MVVLDDLERTRLPAELVFGYVSDLFEEADAKVILLCNEEEISQENKDIFSKSREKIVGLTLSVAPDIDSVFNEFIDGVRDNEFKDFFAKQKQEIINIFNISGTRNLRHIRRIGQEFLRVFQSLQGEIKKNEEYISNLLLYMCIFSIEINSGKLKFEYFEDIENDIWMSRKTIKEFYLYNIIKKYPFQLWRTPVSPKFIKAFFYHGEVLQEEISYFYKVSKYNNDKDSIPTPIKLWYFHEMDDSTANLLYKKMEKELSDRQYKSLGIILHAFSISLFMSDIGIEKKDKKTIIEGAKEYIRNIELEIGEKDISIFEYPTYSYASLGFHCKDADEFKEIFEVARETLESKLDEEKRKSILDSYKHLPENVDLFLEKFSFSSRIYMNNYINIQDIDIQDFARRISKLQQPDIHKVMTHILNTIQGHYERHRNEGNIQPWVTDFYTELQKVSERMPLLAGWRLRLFVVGLQNLTEKYNHPQN